MADDKLAAADTAGGDTAAAAVADTAAAVVDDKTLLGGGDDTAGDTGGAGKGADAGSEDWRTAYGDDKEVQKLLARLASPADVAKKLLNQEKTIRSRPAAPTLPEGATPEEIAAYRKAAGIPEAPDGYDIKFPDELGATEADTAALDDFKAFAHERHMTPAAAKAASDWYMKRMGEARVAMAEAAKEATMNGLVELRAEWKGKEFTRNMRVGLENVEAALGDKAGELAHLALANGQKLGDHPLFLRYAVHNGRATADDDALIGGDGAGGGKSIKEEFDELIKESVANPKQFNRTQSKVARLEELATAMTRDERRAGAR